MTKHKNLLILSTIILFNPTFLYADELSNRILTEEEKNYLEEKTALKRKNEILSSKVLIAEKEKKLKEIKEGTSSEKDQEPSSKQSAFSPFNPYSPYSSTKQEDKGPKNPSIKRVIGFGGNNLKATLNIPDTGEVTVREGDVISGDKRVTRISKNSVTLVSSDGVKQVIGFSN